MDGRGTLLRCALVLVVGTLGTYSGGGDPFANQPKLLVENGHLTIRSAFNRNISLLSSGRGIVQVNSVDLGASNVGDTLQPGSMSSVNNRIMSLVFQQWQLVNVLASRVGQLEDNVTEISNKLDQFMGPEQNRITNRGMRRYFAKVKKLEEKLNHLTELLSTDECRSNPCRNGGTCVDTYNGFFCKCPPAWEGSVCDTDVNECARYAGSAFGCQNGATCTNLPGSYRCDCATNWYGIHCTEQHDDCSAASHQELCGHGTCVNVKRTQSGQANFRCICEPGWTTGPGSPACTQDVDECAGAEPKCSTSPRVQCINLPGTFYCGSCPAGYTGNGLWCADVDECQTGNGGCSVDPFVECYNTPGSRRCGPCPTGYFGNGEQCMYQGVCSRNRGGCHPLATCIDNPAITATYRECRCPPGYVGSGEGPTGCVQRQGTTCSDNPCQHGVCQMLGNSFHCVCESGFYGARCELAEDPCSGAPCVNGGTCVRGRGSTFTCTCPEGYSGPTCAEARLTCGGYLRGDNGTLRYPQENANYEHSASCAWVITVTQGKVINLTFDHFHLETGFDCEHDFLQLNDGPHAGSRVVGRFCSDELHGASFTSTHDEVYLWFRSDRSVSATGFALSWQAVDPVCGGVVNETEYGSIKSPGYPGDYPLNRTCSWLVQVPLGKRIQFSFATLMLEHHPNCSFDYLKVFDGASENDPEIGSFCSTATPPPLVTSGHTATLVFHSDHSVRDKGFNIAYSATPAVQGCGGTLTAPQGSVASPEFPNVYQDNLLCEWLIRLHPENRVRISFTDFHLEAHGSCAYDFLEVFDGASEDSPLLGRFCGNSLPPDILSNGNKLYIRFRTDYSSRYPGFKLDYRTVCGGIFTDLTGTLTSPFYPDAYPANAVCLYEIRLPVGYLVNLTIHNIDIEAHSDCKYDYLEVRDGDTENARQMALLCTNSAPESLLSTYNFMLLKFVTDGSVQNLGFSARYDALDVGCGGVMTEEGQIASPRHPDSYPHSTSCTWLVRAPPGHIVQLTFSRFVLEESPACAYDYLRVADASGVQIGKFCGTRRPPVITSMDDTLVVQFVADASVARDGFSATYRFLDAKEACGGHFFHESGVVRSPGFPEHYPHAARCAWVLQAPTGRQITLNVSSFHLEQHSGCDYDYLAIRNGAYETSPLVGKFCGDSAPPVVRSHSNTIRLEFASDNSMSAPGFEIFFDSTAVGCGGVLTSSRGSIVSPNYPQPYPLNAVCEWVIRVSAGSIISLTLVDIDIEESSTCQFDYLEVYDGDSENSDSLARVCNAQQHVSHVQSTGNAMLLRFRSDSSTAAGGFHAAYHTVCNNISTKRRGVIESPNFPNSYPHNHNCSWVIQAPAGNNISISFSHLFIERATNCSLDYVEILENRPDGPVPRGKFCGDMSTPPGTIQIGSNSALVRLITDRSISMEGFRLEYSMNGCGGDIFNKPSGAITSPNYPHGYPVDTECTWHLRYPPGSRVELTVEELDIEQHPDCAFDFLAVYANEMLTNPLLKLCHTASNQTVLTSHGNSLYIHFKTDLSVSRRGFKASFRQLQGGCGGLFKGEGGVLQSPGFLSGSAYAPEDDCEYLLEVQASSRVQLQFFDFEMPDAASCAHGSVAVYDGRNNSAPKIAQLCGSEKPSAPLYSSGNFMLVHLVADGVNVARGFRARFSQACGARLLADNGGEIHSPNFPDISVAIANCSWIIFASDPGEKVSLTLSHLYFPDRQNCTYSSVQVFDGDTDDAPKIADFCGATLPPPLVSRGNILRVFQRNRGIFRATYGLLSQHCGGTFTSASGAFSSPGYPVNYDMDMECVWTIRASPGNTVRVNFQFFHLEESEYCNSDYVEIHEGDVSGPLIGRFCGDRTPNVARAQSLWIKFRSDDVGTSRGFMADYQMDFGGVLNGTSGELASPGYPHAWTEAGEFEWTIEVPEGMFVSLAFTDFGVGGGYEGDCSSNVQIFDGSSNEAPSLGKFCGYRIPDPIVTTSNIATVVSQGSAYHPNKFYIHWSAVTEGGVSLSEVENNTCVHEYFVDGINATVISSPNHPGKYPDDMNCTYLVRTNHSSHVVLTFTSFEMEAASQCLFDRLEAYYAPNPNVDQWVLNSTFCGTLPQFQLASPNSLLKLVMVTDRVLNYTGFTAVASAECGGHVFGSSGVLRSSSIQPQLRSLGPSGSLQCEWVVTVRPRRTVRLAFDSFDVPSDAVCSSSYILFRNGGFSTSPLLGSGRYCGSTVPEVPETSTSDVYVMLNYNPATGSQPSFVLRYEEVSMGCGGHIYLSHERPYAEVLSPNYPSPPYHDVECLWVVSSPGGTRMRVDFEEEFHLSPNCFEGEQTEYLQLYDGGTQEAEVLQRFCGHDQPSSEMTSSNALLLKYHTAVENPQAGFKSTVRIAHCGGTVSSSHAVVSSPDHPGNYSSGLECEWRITMKSHYHITLNVTDFLTPAAPNCSLTDFLEIREMSPDGEKGDVITVLCGPQSSLPMRVDVPGAFAYLRFKSNSAVTARGFSLRVEANYDEGCGGTLQDPTGVITSPRYPSAIPAKRTCYWRIHAPEGKAIKVTFDALNLPFDERSNKCSSFVTVFNVTSRRIFKEESYAHRYCGNVVPGVIRSGGSTLYVHYVQESLSPGEGFSLRYSTEEPAMCGGVYVSRSGILQTPRFPVVPHSHVDCRWRIDIEPNQTLALVFEYLDLPGRRANYCRDGVLYVVAGNNYLLALCGNTSDYRVTTPYTSNSLRLIAALDVPFRGFKGTYNVSDCGGFVEASNAVITSPGYPNAYPQRTDCHWVLQVPEGEVIRLTAEDLRLEEDCSKDYVIIRNGYYLDSPVIGHFCGTHNPLPIVSAGGTLNIIFHSDDFGTAPGFKFHTVEVQRGCGGTVQTRSGNFSSPNYPARYGNNVECVWTIEYASGYLVSVAFDGRFDIETDATCSKDYLQVEDWTAGGRWELRERKCGSSTPPTLLSKTNKLRLTFHSNERIAGDGFSLHYSTVCGGNFTSPRGSFISPNYPSLYENNMSCTYYVGQRGDYVTISFDEYFSVEGVDNCIYDYVEVFQTAENESFSQGKFCGTEPPAERTLQGPVIVKFYTDYTYVANGFKVNFSILSCGTTLSGPSGAISSPAVRSDYKREIECTWHIQVEQNKVIAIRFLHFDIPPSYRCWKSYLSVKDGDESAPALGKLCGLVPGAIVSSGPRLTLKFYSDLDSPSSGFQLYYYTTYGPAEGCGGTINATSGEITSPDFDRDGRYDSDLDCGWTVVANVPDQVIKLTFDRFDLEDPLNGTCSEDYVEIRDEGATGPLIGYYCGTSNPRPIISSANQVFVLFHSNAVVNSAGFKISFTVMPSPCGPSALVASAAPKTLTSPGYPGPYPANLRCSWSVFLDEAGRNLSGGFVQLAVTDLDVSCSGDYLEIRNTPLPFSRPGQSRRNVNRDMDEQMRSLYQPIRACGMAPPQAATYNPGVRVSFHSDAAYSGARGFSLTYRYATCDGNYSGEGGVLSNPAFPGRFNFQDSCRINVTAAPGRTLALYFRYFETSYADRARRCASSYMKVYDGDSVSSPLLGTFCGFSVPNPVFSTGRSLLIDVKLSHTLGLYHMTYMASDLGRGCGGRVTATEGAVSSPLYPAPYNRSAECVWRLAVPGYHTVQLEFRAFALNSSAGCESNYLEIFDGPSSTSSARIVRLCGGDRPAVYNTRSNQVILKLLTDTTNDRPGFLASFRSNAIVPDSSSVLMQRASTLQVDNY